MLKEIVIGVTILVAGWFVISGGDTSGIQNLVSQASDKISETSELVETSSSSSESDTTSVCKGNADKEAERFKLKVYPTYSYKVIMSEEFDNIDEGVKWANSYANWNQEINKNILCGNPTKVMVLLYEFKGTNVYGAPDSFTKPIICDQNGEFIEQSYNC